LPADTPPPEVNGPSRVLPAARELPEHRLAVLETVRAGPWAFTAETPREAHVRREAEGAVFRLHQREHLLRVERRVLAEVEGDAPRVRLAAEHLELAELALERH